MPRVASYTPAWLSRPSTGYDFFSRPQDPPSSSSTSHSSSASTVGPLRTVACHGTQVFTVVGNELRWSDLVLLKEQWESERNSQKRARHLNTSIGFHSRIVADDDDDDSANLESSYKVLKVPVSRQIQQLVINQTGDYMAIVTSHTVHVAVLPDPSHLTASDTAELKLKTFQLGPTIHVLERSPVVSALWHPLGVQATALVTVTADSVVRLWELDRSNRWSFDSPTLAIDLKKLADAHSTTEDFSPSKYGTNKGFSPDSFEMEAAAACFGGTAQRAEPPWAPMTLWVAMKEGDIYALCPFLPTKLDPPDFFVQDLASSIRLQAASLARTEVPTSRQRKLKDQQLAWLADIEKQSSESVLHRPTSPGPIPQLQGPFRLAPDPDLMFRIADIYVVSPAYDDTADSQSSMAPSDSQLCPSLEFLCIATTDGIVQICANLDAIEACWLPTRASSYVLENGQYGADQELLVVETISLSRNSTPGWPLITPDALSQTSIFVTHDAGVTHIDMSSLTNGLLRELNQGSGPGSEFRIGMLVEDSPSSIQQILTFNNRLGDRASYSSNPTACVDVYDSDLGHFILTVVGSEPYSATLTDDGLEYAADESLVSKADEIVIQSLVTSDSRPPYQPPKEFWMESALQSFMDQQVHSRSRRFMGEEVRLSPVTLNLLMEAHRVLSYQTHRLGVAAGDLFSRCERLLSEFNEHVERTKEVSSRVDNLLGVDSDPYTESSRDGLFDTTEPNVQERLETARDRQQKLTERYDKLRKSLTVMHGRALSDKEKAWMKEINQMSQLFGKDNTEYGETGNGRISTPLSTPSDRLESLKMLKSRLVAEAQEIADQADATTKVKSEDDGQNHDIDSDPWDGLDVKPERRKARLAEIDSMLERQIALVDATRGKLERLHQVAA